MKSISFVSLFVLYVLSFACSGTQLNSSTSSQLTHAQLTARNLLSIEKEKEFKKAHSFEYSGIVRSVQPVSTKTNNETIQSTLVGFELEDGSLKKIRLRNPEVRIWQGMYATIIIEQYYETLNTGEFTFVFGEYDFMSGDLLYKLLYVENLERK